MFIFFLGIVCTRLRRRMIQWGG